MLSDTDYRDNTFPVKSLWLFFFQDEHSKATAASQSGLIGSH